MLDCSICPMNCREFKLEQASIERTIYGTSILSNIVRERELQIHFTNQSEDYQLQVRVLLREHLNCLSFYSRLVTYKLFAPNSVSLFFRLLNYRLMISPQFDIGGDHQKCKSSVLDLPASFFYLLTYASKAEFFDSVFILTTSLTGA